MKFCQQIMSETIFLDDQDKFTPGKIATATTTTL